MFFSLSRRHYILIIAKNNIFGLPKLIIEGAYYGPFDVMKITEFILLKNTSCPFPGIFTSFLIQRSAHQHPKRSLVNQDEDP